MKKTETKNSRATVPLKRPFVRETFCYGDVLFGTHVVTETFPMEMFCQRDILSVCRVKMSDVTMLSSLSKLCHMSWSEGLKRGMGWERDDQWLVGISAVNFKHEIRLE